MGARNLDGGRDGGLATVLSPIAALITRHPRWVLGIWLLVMAVLAWRGFGLEEQLASRPVYVDGTETARAHQLSVQRFGSEDAQVVMLQGPPAAVERQGRRLARRLGARRGTLVISPWTAGGTIDGLQPRPDVAGLLVNTERNGGGSAADLGEVVERTVHEPVRADLAGGPAIVTSLHDSIESATEVGEKIAIPVLLIVLLLVCRSLLAAALPVVVGGVVAAAAKGVLYLLHPLVGLDPFALGAAAMLGLALGVDYSLLVVARFRQERRGEGDDAAATHRTVLTVGRSVLPAGGGLFLAMAIAAAMLPGRVGSIAIATAIVSLLSVAAAMLATPSLLLIGGRYLDRWSLPPRRDDGGAVMRWSRRISTRPVLVLALLFALMLSAAWAVTLDTGTGAVAQLPPDDPGRQQQEAIQRNLGAGWIGPLEVVVDGRDGPVTTKQRLDALTAFQSRVEADPGVASMAGFKAFRSSTRRLGGVEDELGKQERGLDRLDHGLGKVEEGAGANTEGLESAAAGARELNSAVEGSRKGSGGLADGLRRSSGGSERLSGGLENASEGSGELAEGASKASNAAAKLANKVDDAQEEADQAGTTRTLESALTDGEDDLAGTEEPVAATESQLVAAWAALTQMTAGRADPQYKPALEAVEAAIAQITGAPAGAEEPPRPVASGIKRAKDQFNLSQYLTERLSKKSEQNKDDVDKLARSTRKLDRALRKLDRGSRKLDSGIGGLSDGSERLTPGLQRLTHGAEQLHGGLGKIAAGTEELSGGLGSGAVRSHGLSSGLHRIHGGVEDQQGDSGLQRVDEHSPGLFHSGYFYLAGFDGSKPGQRQRAGLLINLDGGGTSARMLVVPTDEPASAGAAATAARIREDARRLSRQTGMEVFVGGWGTSLDDLNSALRDRGPVIRLVLSLVTIAIILLVTRSLALALLAAALNLLTVSATFGLLALLFDDSLLGGPGYVDSSMIALSVTLVFALAIDYEVFVFARIREEYLRTGSTAQAIDNGLSRTAQVITGAALIMCAAFLAFAASPLISMRNLGIGLTISTAIDALAIRFVLVPAAMRALGDRSWWIPRRLERLLPGGRRAVGGVTPELRKDPA